MTAELNPNDLPAVLDQLRQAEPDLEDSYYLGHKTVHRVARILHRH